ncbi:hypothetical protein BAUCODRAFT_492594 [Baudoinia panamericana UAMH 10762]|uniref:Carbohydrate kinase PfkB domain-containing protein n=1 Tax=Baudoinia panamericana (strain UAMH 10762) TaxID=717646 RepID=M2N9P7_BAUPA|nr:uncharacterized protein BAUCODRAFT_492594 [Baudoinia panamericana UAMH 10762]EMC95520.1 hypothetical protein BAUCODRAFT_492594 [Baudoinia panamericana UAMH 10762]
MSGSSVIRLVALGNGVWLDEIRRTGQQPIRDVPGGSVTFATVGARLFVPDEPRSIGLVFHAGADFPPDVIELFRSWGVTLDLKHVKAPSARGVVFYDEANDERKGFERLTKPLPITVDDLSGTRLLAASAFHFFGTAQYVEESVSHLVRLRQANHHSQTRPFVVWEPEAKSCRPDTLSAHQQAASSVNVFSPNHLELASFFADATATFDKAVIERHAAMFLDAGIGTNGEGCIIVRAASHGCLVMSRQVEARWLPAYYEPGSGKIIDATGAGNAFLGAFIIGWLETGSFLEGAICGQVAASFVIEQVGLPRLSGHGSSEVWNDCNVIDRLVAYRKRFKEDGEKGGRGGR